MDRGGTSDENQTQTNDDGDKNSTAPKPTKTLSIENAEEYVAEGDAQHPGDVKLTYDSSLTTGWRTSSYKDGPDIVIKPGVGIVYDLGSAQEVSAATLSLRYPGNRTTVELYAADSLTPSSLDSLDKIGSATTKNTTATVKISKPVKSRYVLVWLTALPYSGSDPANYSDAGYKQAITNVKFTG